MDAETERRLREKFARSHDTVVRAHERAVQAVDRAARIRETLRADSEAVREGQREARRRVRLLQLAAEESARTARARDRFLAAISHELRQPLNAALTDLRMVEVGGDAAEPARAMLRRQLLQMARLVDNLLDMSRMSLDVTDMQLGHVDLDAVLDDAVSTIETELVSHDLTLVRVPLEAAVCVWGDESRLRQVFSNLLGNAARDTPAGGRITLETTVARAQVVIAVTDTGRGIAESELPRVFDPFTRDDGAHEGFGIGLALVRGIVELHRGSTSVASPGEGRGSTFTVNLPLCSHSVLKGTQAAPLSR